MSPRIAGTRAGGVRTPTADEIRAKTMTAAAREMRELGELTDVTLVCGDKTFPCHRLVLAALSEYFRTLFRFGMADSSSPPTVNLDQFQPDVVGTVVEILYGQRCDTLTNDKRELGRLMEAADFLQIKFLFDFCCQKYLDGVSLRLIADEISLANEMNSSPIMLNTLFDFMARNIYKVLFTDECLGLEFPVIRLLVEHLNVRHALHETVMVLILQWVKRDAEGRTDKLVELMKLVRLPTRLSAYLKRMMVNEELVQSSPAALSLLTDARLNQQTNGYALHHLRIFFLDRSLNIFNQCDCYVDRVADEVTLMQFFDTEAGAFSHIIDLPFKFGHCGKSSLAYMNGSIYFFGCNSVENSVAHLRQGPCKPLGVFKYTLSSPFLTKLALMTHPRFGTGASVFNGRVYSVGGDREDNSERYDPKTNSWEGVEPLALTEFCCKPHLVTVDDRMYAVSLDENSNIQEYSQSRWSTICDPPFRSLASDNEGVQFPAAGCLGELFVHFGEESLWSYNKSSEKWKKVKCDIKDVAGLWSVSTESVRVPFLFILDKRGHMHRYDPATGVSFMYPGALNFLDLQTSKFRCTMLACAGCDD